jgi:hypothetical protein
LTTQELKYERRLVAFIDILGFKEIVKQSEYNTSKIELLYSVLDFLKGIGIVTLPNGAHFAISVFISNSKENSETNEEIISDISKLTWDYFIGIAK